MPQKENEPNADRPTPAGRSSVRIWKEWRFILFLFALAFIVTLSSALLVMKVSLGGAGTAVTFTKSKSYSR